MLPIAKLKRGVKDEGFSWNRNHHSVFVCREAFQRVAAAMEQFLPLTISLLCDFVCHRDSLVGRTEFLMRGHDRDRDMFPGAILRRILHTS